MEFITVEQFQEQPLKVKEVFMDWWKCDYGDLYYYNEDPLEYKDFEIINNELECNLNGDFDYFKSIGVIPIFTEGQLRRFIEEKTKSIVTTDYDVLKETYEIYLSSIVDNKEDYGWFHNVGKDLLQAYWIVACKIAKELTIKN